VVAYGVNVYNGQLVNCQTGINCQYGTVNARNMLFAKVQSGFNFNSSGAYVQNTTFSSNSIIINSGSGSLVLNNCILANVSQLTNSSSYSTISGDHNGFYNSPVFGTGQVINNSYPFQTVGGGSYYLANGCSFFNAGTTNIDATLLAGLKQRTTYPPIVYANQTISVPLTLSPQAQRDTDTPDLGYHYDPLDYVFGGCDLYTNLTLAAGTAVGWYQDYGSVYSSYQPYGISLNDGANFTSTGTATQPCWLACTMAVQEGGNGNWTGRGWMGEIMLNGSGSGVVPQLNSQFTRWNSDGNHFRDNWDQGKGTFSNCEFYTGGLATYDQSSLYFTNCLFFRDGIYFFDQYAALTFTFQNCTFYDGFIAMCRFTGQSSSFWTIKNTAFDGTGFSTQDNFNANTNYTAFDYNAYNSNNLSWQTYSYPYTPVTNKLEVAGPHDVIVTNYNWQSSWLGNYYLPTNSPLINVGSTNANLLGLYHYTTQVNQVKETNSIVDIGYHYVAVDTNGIPFDTNGDGIPDYLEDANGNGLIDSGEIGWNIFGDLGLKVIITRPRNGSILP
jgi:hypothetical protein